MDARKPGFWVSNILSFCPPVQIARRWSRWNDEHIEDRSSLAHSAIAQILVPEVDGFATTTTKKTWTVSLK
eukprot:4315980-Amphidinium_carterae.1